MMFADGFGEARSRSEEEMMSRIASSLRRELDAEAPTTNVIMFLVGSETLKVYTTMNGPG